MTLHMEARIAPPSGALLIRMVVSGPAALMALPRVPAPHTVTITCSDASARARLDEGALARLGYRLVGNHTASTDGSMLELLLLARSALLDAQPAWATAVLAKADRVFDCDLGPVQYLFGALLDCHLAE